MRLQIKTHNGYGHGDCTINTDADNFIISVIYTKVRSV